MDHLALVDILHTLNELLNVVSGFKLVETFPSPDKVTKGLIMANIEYHVHIFLVLEVAIETYNVLVEERAVDLDLTGKLLTSFAPCQVCL